MKKSVGIWSSFVSRCVIFFLVTCLLLTRFIRQVEPMHLALRKDGPRQCFDAAQIENVRSIHSRVFMSQTFKGGLAVPVTLPIEAASQSSYSRIAHVLAILLREFYLYRSVEVMHVPRVTSTTTGQDYFNEESARLLDQLSQLKCAGCRALLPSRDRPRQADFRCTFASNISNHLNCPVVSLTVPMPPGFNVERWTVREFIGDAGPLGPNVRPGWFIDKQWMLSVWEKYGETMESWRLITSSTKRGQFYLEYGKWLSNMPGASAYRVFGSTDNMCTQARCAQCVLVIVLHDYELAKQAVLQASAMNFTVCAVVLNNISEVNEAIAINRKLLSPAPLLFGWSPSELTSRFALARIALDSCMDDFGPNRPLHCDYPTNQLSKVVSFRLLHSYPDVWQLVKKLHISQQDFASLLTQVGQDDEDAACEWMKAGWSNFGGSNQVEQCFNDSMRASTLSRCPWCCWNDWRELRQKPKIYIGVFYPTGSRWEDATLQMAANFAQNHINLDSTLLEDYSLELVESRVACHRDIALQSYIDMVHRCQEMHEMQCPLVGIIGSVCSEALKPVVEVSRHYYTTIISPTVEADELSDVTKFPFFFRTVPSMKFYSKALRRFVQHYKWNRIGIVAQHSMFLDRNVFENKEKVEGFEEAENMELCSYKVVSDQELTVTTAIGILNKAIRSRCRILASDHFVLGTCRLMCAATHLKMQPEEGYVWILSPWLPMSWSVMENVDEMNTSIINCFTSLTKEERAYCPNDEFQRTTQGYFVLRTERTVTLFDQKNNEKPVLTVGNVSRVQLQTHIQRMNKAEEPQDSQYFFYYMYDAVWTLARAIDTLLKMDSTALQTLDVNTTAIKLKQIIESTSFEGLSGNVTFSMQHNRQQGIFKVFQYVQQGNRKSLEQDKQRGSFQEFLKKHKNMTFNVNELESFGKKEMGLGQDIDYSIAEIKWETDKNDSLKENSLLFRTIAKKVLWFTKNGQPPSDGTLHVGDECPMLKPLLYAFSMRQCHETTYLFIVFGVFCLLLGIILFVVFYFRSKSRDLAIQLQMEEPFRVVQCELAEKEINRNEVLISRKLGEGNFGTVYGGEAKINNKWESCAIKTLTLTASTSTEEKLYFLHEARTMRLFDHPNVVHLLGVCTLDDPFYIIVELCMFGDLKSFLLTRRHTALNSPEDTNISAEALTRYCKDIVCGLAYIHAQKLVHRDLALRNCLVHQWVKGDMVIVKVGDFGFARSVIDKNYYRFERKAEMPLRWMPPESIQFGYFTFQTDVWAFGVVMYEIITFGGFPYGDLSTSQVMEHLKYCKGGSTPLPLPTKATPELHMLVAWCHQYESSKRPSTADLIEYFETHTTCVTACLEDSPPDPGEEILGVSRFAQLANRSSGVKTPTAEDRGRHKSGDRLGAFGSVPGDSTMRLNQTSINSSNRNSAVASGTNSARWFTTKSDSRRQIHLSNSCELLTQHFPNTYYQHYHVGGGGSNIVDRTGFSRGSHHHISRNVPEMSTASMPMDFGIRHHVSNGHLYLTDDENYLTTALDDAEAVTIRLHSSSGSVAVGDGGGGSAAAATAEQQTPDEEQMHLLTRV